MGKADSHHTYQVLQIVCSSKREREGDQTETHCYGRDYKLHIFSVEGVGQTLDPFYVCYGLFQIINEALNVSKITSLKNSKNSMSLLKRNATFKKFFYQQTAQTYIFAAVIGNVRLKQLQIGSSTTKFFHTKYKRERLHSEAIMQITNTFSFMVVLCMHTTDVNEFR